VKLGARTIRRLATSLMAEAPPRTPLEAARLERPVMQVTRDLLAFRPALVSLPLDEGLEEFRPMIVRALEEIALDCEQDGEAGEAARAKVVAWLDTLTMAVRQRHGPA
jgi:hypothetical protein